MEWNLIIYCFFNDYFAESCGIYVAVYKEVCQLNGRQTRVSEQELLGWCPSDEDNVCCNSVIELINIREIGGFHVCLITC